MIRARQVVGLCAWFLTVSGCSDEDEPRAERTQSQTPDSCVVVEFLYLLSEERAKATLCADSTLVVRRNAADSVLSDTRKATSAQARAQFDSLLIALARVEPGTYRKENVIDGTRIWLYHGGDTVFCDNCLHDYILEAAGADGGRPPGGAEDIKDAVARASEMIAHAEGRHVKGMKGVKIIVDKSKMSDTSRAYEVDTTGK